MKQPLTLLSFIHYIFFNFAVGVLNTGAEATKSSQYVFYNIAPYYLGFNLLKKVKIRDSNIYKMIATDYGSSFYGMLEVNKTCKDS